MKPPDEMPDTVMNVGSMLSGAASSSSVAAAATGFAPPSARDSASVPASTAHTEAAASRA